MTSTSTQVQRFSAPAAGRYRVDPARDVTRPVTLAIESASTWP